MAMSDLAEADVGSVYLGAGSTSRPATLYLALFKSATGLESGSAAQEVQTSATLGYNRQLCALTDDSSGGTVSFSNTAAETFTASGGAWSDVTHVGLCASGTPGTNDVWFYDALDSAITNIGDGSSVQFAAGALDIAVT